MAIKSPVKTIDEAFRISCEKNGIEIRERKRSRKSMQVRDENNNVYTIFDDLSIKKGVKKPYFRKFVGFHVLPKRIGIPTSTPKKHSGLFRRNLKELTKA